MKTARTKAHGLPHAQGRPSASPAPPVPKSEIQSQNSEITRLAVTGMSPAVLTETVSALVKEDPPVLPGRVIAARNRAADASAELPDLRR